MMSTSESSYLLSPQKQRDPSLAFIVPCDLFFFFNHKWLEMKTLSVKTGWLLSVVSCVHLFYPANKFASVLLLCEYSLLVNLSARNFTQTTCFKQILEHTIERQCLHLQNMF